MALFDEILGDLRSGIESLAKASWSDVQQGAIRDGNAFLQRARGDLERWTTQLAAGEITPKDFEFLLAAKKDLAELEALKAAGLSAARLGQFRDALIAQVISTIVGKVL